MSLSLFAEHMPRLFALVNPSPRELARPLSDVLEASYTFSRMLHASKSPTGGGGMESSGFYRAYVPEVGSVLDPAKLGALGFRRGSSETVSSWSTSRRAYQAVLPNGARSALRPRFRLLALSWN